MGSRKPHLQHDIPDGREREGADDDRVLQSLAAAHLLAILRGADIDCQQLKRALRHSQHVLLRRETVVMAQ
eukprot:23424-Eustigmatos_ZCMA.PRE.1